jgi:hypothetical protein
MKLRHTAPRVMLSASYSRWAITVCDIAQRTQPVGTGHGGVQKYAASNSKNRSYLGNRPETGRSIPRTLSIRHGQQTK